jgi:uncharacterized protein YdiU (UPF0061 family)
MIPFNIYDTFTAALPADPVKENYRRQVKGACFSYVKPTPVRAPKLVAWSDEVAKLLGIERKAIYEEELLEIFAGNKSIEDFNSYAQCYGGHQFGHWAGQLGDGRAINIAEVRHLRKQWILQLKGAGPTPYSRSADGLAVLRSSVREFLCSEAMYYLGVPTTRALSLVTTGEDVTRDMLYDGNPKDEPGAIVCRVAESFLRFGNFQILLAQNDKENLQKLIDYTLTQFFPEIGKPSKSSYIELFRTISQRTLDMIIHWQRVGFVHGVMNTDNMSILGLTIDYGPYGWLEGFDYGWTPNTTDAQNRRYRFGQQPSVGLWNLAQLASAFHPLIEDKAALEAILDEYRSNFQTQFFEMMMAKLGLSGNQDSDKRILSKLIETLHLAETDMTLFFRHLIKVKKEHSAKEGLTIVQDAFYKLSDISDSVEKNWMEWFQLYTDRLKQMELDEDQRTAMMSKNNPKYVLRNYMAQLAIEKAEKGDFTILNELSEMLKQPYEEAPQYEHWFEKRPEWARHKVGCSMLSCSS